MRVEPNDLNEPDDQMSPRRLMLVSTVSMRWKPQAGYSVDFDLWRYAAGSSFVGDDLLQVFEAVAREGGSAVLADAIDPKAAIQSRRPSVDRTLFLGS
jgi:hypothetical protein